MTEHTRKTVEIGKNLEICLSYWKPITDNVIVSAIIISSGCGRLQANITPAEARELANVLMRYADEVEEAIN